MKTILILRLLFIGSSLFLLQACTSQQSASRATSCSPTTLTELDQCLNSAGLTPDSSQSNYIEITSFPENIIEISDIKKKKQLFFYTLIPLIQELNLELKKSRNRLKQLHTAYTHNRPFSKVEKQFIADLARKVRTTITDISQDTFDTLLDRVDTIPIDLILAQAANESAWGSSRFAQLGNNIFGEWTFTPGTGIIPKGRPEGKTYEIKKFNSIKDSIYSYMTNLNSHRSYKTFRELRAKHRLNGDTATGTDLAEGLLYYSTRRNDYVREIKEMIRGNKLEVFNDIEIQF